MRLTMLFLGVLSTSCVATVFTCENDNQCKGVVGGRCEVAGFCSAPDPTCATGYRYAKYSSNRLSGACVALQVDLGGVDLRGGNDQSATFDLCVGSVNDPNNCGGCGVVCASGQFCSQGSCSCPAPIPDFCGADGGSFCTNEQTDVENCGTCGSVCPSGQLCQTGACVETCATTPIAYTNCTTYCADLQSDPSNCGGCGDACSANNIIAMCANGACDGICAAGFADCDNNVRTDGCEINTTNDVNNCGGCAQPCAIDANASSVECVMSACSQVCNAGYASCGTTCCAQRALALLAGSLGGAGDVDGPPNSARFNNPQGIAIDPSGTIYVADVSNGAIRKITPSGVVSTLATVNATYLAVDASGTVYVTSPPGVCIIQTVTPTGVVSTLAGRAGTCFAYAPGVGTAAQFGAPEGIAVDATGNLYVADPSSILILKIAPGAVVSTFAGQYQMPGTVDGTGTAASFTGPWGVGIDATGDIYVGTQGDGSVGDAVRKITPARVVSTLAAPVVSPVDVGVDGAGNVYIADLASVVFNVTPSLVEISWGSIGSTGSADGVGTAVRFNQPRGVVADATGNVYIADTNNDTIRKISGGVVSTFAGVAGYGSADGSGSAALFNGPNGVAVDSAGNVYVADTNNQTIRKISAAGVVSTLAGSATSGTADGTGSAARFNAPFGVAVDGVGNVYVADANNNSIRKITASGVVSTLAGSTTTGTVDGTGSAAQFNSPSGVAVDGSGNVYVADVANDVIRKITSGGVVTTPAGAATISGTIDGTGSAARFDALHGIAVDAVGNVYVTDLFAIRKMSTTAVVTTIAGNAFGTADGTGSAAQFRSPQALTVDGSGNVFVADNSAGTIRKVTPTGVVSTVIGVPLAPTVVLGPLPGALTKPAGVAIFGDTLIISDNRQHSILRATQVGGF